MLLRMGAEKLFTMNLPQMGSALKREAAVKKLSRQKKLELIKNTKKPTKILTVDKSY